MEEKIIEKNKIKDFIQKLQKDYRIYAPLRENGNFRFSELQTSDSELLSKDYRNTKISPKEIFFPQTEILFPFHADDVGNPNYQLLSSNYLILGIRPCDAKAFYLLDKVFNRGDYRDPYYLIRRENTIITSLACNDPQITCFCTSFGGAPDAVEGSDVIFYDLGDEFLVTFLTPRGEKVCKELEDSFKAAKKPHFEKKEKLVKASLNRIQQILLYINAIKEKLDRSFDASFWDEIHQKCLGCGICTYLCPTCHCFDITDEVRNKEGKRMRCWDSCMFPLFTLHVSGHQPHSTFKERMRQRIMHKFNYCPENFKKMFCVGCGRCIRNCPVNLDIREVLRTVSS